jgi:hypothetical protein
MNSRHLTPILFLLFSLLLMSNNKLEAKRKIPIKLEHVLQLFNNGVGQERNNFLSINKMWLKKKKNLLSN